MSLQAVEAACKRIHNEQKPTSVPKSRPKSLKAGSILGANTPGATAERLSQMLGSVDPKTASEKEKNTIFQNIIGYRKIARSLPDETRSVLDRKIAAFNNSQVKTKPAKKK
jgi:hypothetical protein